MDPEEIPKPPRSQQIKEYKMWIEENSKPRIIPKPPLVSRGPRKPIESFAGLTERLTKVAKSKKYIKPSKDPSSWVYKMKHLVKKEALNYTPTERIIKLATAPIPKEPIPLLVKPTGIMYNMSERLEKLSKPLPRNIVQKYKKNKKKKRGKSKEKKISQRVLKLAEPVIKLCTGINEKPFEVNPIALTYKASKRIREMAKPKQPQLEYIDKPVVANVKLAREKYMKIRIKKKPVEQKRESGNEKKKKK